MKFEAFISKISKELDMSVTYGRELVMNRYIKHMISTDAELVLHTYDMGQLCYCRGYYSKPEYLEKGFHKNYEMVESLACETRFFTLQHENKCLYFSVNGDEFKFYKYGEFNKQKLNWAS